MDPELWEVVEGTGPAEVQAIIRLTDAALMPAGVRVVAQFGDIITCRLPRDSIIEVRTSAATASMKPPVRLLEEPEDALDAAERQGDVLAEHDKRRPDVEETGKGCIVAIVDWGFDFAHRDFREADGRSRLIALWDQRSEDHRLVNNIYGYGHVYSADDVNRALQADDPYAALGYRPWDVDPDGKGTHGTHVAGIAAGNGRSGSPSGIAPEADIIFVHLASEGPAAISSLGNSVTLLEAIDFIAKTAGDRPWVVNLSMGQQGGSHDGTSLTEQALDFMVSDAPGRAVVQSCGNYFDRRIHASGELRPGEKKTLRFQVAATELIPNKIEVWYSKRDTVEVTVLAPDGTASSIVAQGERDVLTQGGRTIGKLYHRANDPNNGNHQVALFIYPGGPTGIWEMTLTAQDVVDGRFHSWIERNNTCPTCQPQFLPEDAVEFSTTGTICNGYRTIAVGAYDAHSPARELGHFSSRGPTAEGRLKPDIVAPGVQVLSSRSATGAGGADADPVTRKSGTSMASPHVTGAVALMFEAAGRLPIEVTRKLLLASAEKVATPEDIALGMGSGYLDIRRAVEAAVRQISPRPPTAVARETVETSSNLPEGGQPKMEETDEMEAAFEGQQNLEPTEADDQLLETQLIESVRRVSHQEPMEEGPLSGRYAVIVGSRAGCLRVRDQLGRLAQAFASAHDLKWAFPYVYGLVTDEVVRFSDGRGFRHDDAVLHWVPNFYELYALNLQSWLQSGRAESPWVTAFSEPGRIAPQEPWGARSAAAFILGMYAHIRSDLPRALAYVFLKFFAGRVDASTGRPHSFDDFKPDFDLMNESVFPRVMERVSGGGVILPSITQLAPASILDSYLAMRTRLPQEREEAWRVGRIYAGNDQVGRFVAGLGTRSSTTSVELGSGRGEVEPEYELVRHAEAALAHGTRFRHAGELVTEVLSRAGITPPGQSRGATGRAPYPAEIYEAVATGGGLSLQQFGDALQVVAAPGARLSVQVAPGDLLVRTSEAGPGHAAMISESRLWSHSELAGAGVASEAVRPGFYATVVEPGPRPHVRADRFARLVTDAEGRLPHDQVLLRVKPLERPAEAPEVAPPAPDSAVANRFIAAHHSRRCSPGDPGATCSALVAPRVVQGVVIHTLAVPCSGRRSGAESVIAGWRDSAGQASAHYIVDRDGTITQMVREGDAAFHVIGHNQHTIGIEHADVCNDPTPYTTALYERSSELVRDLSRRHGFPINDTNVVGHVSVGHHDDPGPYWDWEYYFLLLRWDHHSAADRPMRQVVTAAENRSVPAAWEVAHRRDICPDMCATNIDSFGATYWEAAPAHGAAPAEFTIRIDQPGLYKASMWWPGAAGANPSAPVDVAVTCAHAGSCPDAGSQSTTVNQQRNSGRWNDLGSPFAVRFSAADVRVRIRRDSPAAGWIRADSVRILKVGSV